MTRLGSSGPRLVAVSLAASLALVLAYLALGGASYQPSVVADPCEARDWRDPEGLDEVAEQFTLSALDGAACELRVTREWLAVALATESGRAELVEELGIERSELEDAVQAGLGRAIDDAEDAGALGPFVAAPLREVVSRLPIDEAAAVIADARDFLDDARGMLEDARQLLG